MLRVKQAVVNIQLFGFFNVHINRSGSCWDNHVFDLLVRPRLEMILYQCLQVAFTSDWGTNDTGPGLNPGLNPG